MLTILTANQKGGCGKTSISLTLAVALAHEGYKVAIADADLQKSALRFLKYRPDDVTPIMGIDWRDSDDIGDLTKKIDKAKPDVLIIDAPGAVAGKRAERLIGECDLMFVPVLPSFFDIDSTKRFLKNIADIKRVRKGKVDVHLIANRIRPQLMDGGVPSDKLLAIFDEIGQRPLAYISEKSAYAQLADNALTIFDKTQKPYQNAKGQWQPILALIKNKLSVSGKCSSMSTDGSWF
ncbi:ParA family protein [Moraxella bovis]|uniref:ParA family protein n=1 Tax=Moraxella bovis TaxID=476 RepID=UPI000992661D|nr:ParA family protein [Moraxella bovis]AWY20952.1 ParA family protein [Moraxella bovis]OOR90351.1 chromosome partitioning protein [Moraxella bovis]UZA09094.1 ParA family protein [Moraxella bovis]UZA17304.1 ParA family protein [Moraxella bovis]UZA23734.1 ParA family protein [Moraxella bovis]